MYTANATLTHKKYFLATVTATAAVGSTEVSLSSSKRVTLPQGFVLAFGSVAVSLTQKTKLTPTPTAIQCQALLESISAGATSLDTRGSLPVEPFIQEVIELSVEETNKLLPQDMPGVDATAIPLAGRLVKPRALTSELKVQSKLPMVWQRGLNTELRGMFYLLPSISSRLGLESFFGDYIQGFLQGGVS